MMTMMTPPPSQRCTKLKFWHPPFLVFNSLTPHHPSLLGLGSKDLQVVASQSRKLVTCLSAACFCRFRSKLFSPLSGYSLQLSSEFCRSSALRFNFSCRCFFFSSLSRYSALSLQLPASFFFLFPLSGPQSRFLSILEHSYL